MEKRSLQEDSEIKEKLEFNGELDTEQLKTLTKNVSTEENPVNTATGNPQWRAYSGKMVESVKWRKNESSTSEARDYICRLCCGRTWRLEKKGIQWFLVLLCLNAPPRIDLIAHLRFSLNIVILWIRSPCQPTNHSTHWKGVSITPTCNFVLCVKGAISRLYW